MLARVCKLKLAKPFTQIQNIKRMKYFREIGSAIYTAIVPELLEENSIFKIALSDVR